MNEQLNLNERFKRALEDNYALGLMTITDKNHDYSGATVDPFRNFRYSAAVANVSVEQGFLVRMADKMARLGNLCINPARVENEAFEDTCVDLANYANLLATYRMLKDSLPPLSQAEADEPAQNEPTLVDEDLNVNQEALDYYNGDPGDENDDDDLLPEFNETATPVPTSTDTSVQRLRKLFGL